VPTISGEGNLTLLNARHPLLEENLRKEGIDVVPTSLDLSADRSVMIISGANAGGKTVVLKTAGLLSLMAISGLPVPSEEAEVPFYSAVLADIGDHQSISANLSTFSSHTSNIAGMMRDLRTPALVLLDEVGTGTDPDEGSALGVAIVDHFRKKGAQVMASTHYRGLKIYATNDEKVLNASVEFDEKTLQPTYRLLTGLAGASSGIEIARRFGIPADVIEEAKNSLDVSAREAAEFLMKIKRESEMAEDLRIALEEERDVVAKKYALLDIEAGKREKERQREFENELSETIANFERQSKALIAGIEDKAIKAKLEKELEKSRSELKRNIFTAETQRRGADLSEPGAVVTGSPVKTIDTPVSVGSRVLLKNIGSVGTVEKITGNQAEVLVGSMRMREKLANLQSVSGEPKEKKGKLEKLQEQAKHTLLRIDTESVSAELNIIGKKTDVVDTEVDRFLDESFMNGLSHVRIVHGMGTGALRGAVHDFLRHHPHVAKYTLAPQDQGGAGATIVELKQ
jgi:DNA mismatch repair protein MutS2